MTTGSENSELAEVTEKELLLEIFRQARAIKRFLYFLAIYPWIVAVLVALYTVADSR